MTDESDGPLGLWVKTVEGWFHDYSKGLDTAGASETDFFEDWYQGIHGGSADPMEALFRAWAYVGTQNPDMQEEIKQLVFARPVLDAKGNVLGRVEGKGEMSGEPEAIVTEAPKRCPECGLFNGHLVCPRWVGQQGLAPSDPVEGQPLAWLSEMSESDVAGCHEITIDKPTHPDYHHGLHLRHRRLVGPWMVYDDVDREVVAEDQSHRTCVSIDHCAARNALVEGEPVERAKSVGRQWREGPRKPWYSASPSSWTIANKTGEDGEYREVYTHPVEGEGAREAHRSGYASAVEMFSENPVDESNEEAEEALAWNALASGYR